MCKDIYLRIWEECIGLYEGLEVNEFEVAVILSCNGSRVRLTFLADMATLIKKNMKNIQSMPVEELKNVIIELLKKLCELMEFEDKFGKYLLQRLEMIYE